MNPSLQPYATMLDSLLMAFVAIERFEEPALVSEDRLSARWGWGNWNEAPAPVLLLNDSLFSASNYTLDLTAGTATFTSAIPAGSEMRAVYSFRLLSLDQYESFFSIGLSMANLRKPQSAYTFEGMPATWGGLLTLNAFAQAAKAVCLKLNMFKYRRLFENPDGLLAQLQSTSAAAEAQWATNLATMKRRGDAPPLGLATMNRNVPYTIDGTNFRDYVVGAQ